MRNNETFSSLPEIEGVPRTRFDRPSTTHTTFDAGQIIPFYWDEVIAGDSFDITCVSNVRMTTPIVPVMDSCYLDTYFFFVPSRLCWNRWKEFCGENPRGNWTNGIDDDLHLPQIVLFGHELSGNPDPSVEDVFGNQRFMGSLLDYFGIPFMEFYPRDAVVDPVYTNPENYPSINMLPFEAYNLIWNEFFRDQNTMDPALLLLQNTSDSDPEAVFGHYYSSDYDFEPDVSDNGVTYSERSGYLHVKRACKFHDYFTSALPQPQKHAPIVIPGFDVFNQNVDIVATYDRDRYHKSPAAVAYGSLDNANPLTHSGDIGLKNGYSSSTAQADTSSNSYITPINLIGQYTGSLPNINDLRNAFALQRLFERDGFGGSRYIEQLKVHFGVTSPDARLQRPEYLGGSRSTINMNQVVQTSSSDGVSPQGNVSGVSHSFNIDDSFFKSFTEPGYILGLAVVRPIHSYQNGINKQFLRKRRFDFYYPALAFIGEQPISDLEINFSQYDVNDPSESYFGYQEAHAEYRYKPNMITGKMRSDVPGSLDIWHYGDDYSKDFVTLSPNFLFEKGDTIQRTLAIQDEPQFFGDFYVDCKVTRELPLYSVPGLVDHY